MTQNEFNKLDKQEQVEMLKEVEEQFNVDLPIVEPKYDDDGNIKNQKEVDNSLKKVLPIALSIWSLSYAVIKDKCIKTMVYTNNFVNSLKKAKKLQKTMITTEEWEKIIDKTVKDREKRIKIKQVIKGNANLLNKRVQETVKNGYKNGKNYKQISKELQKQFGYSEGKAKTIAITERNYYKSSAQLAAIENCSKFVKKTWIHNPSRMPRDSHVHADGQVADKKGYFKVNGYKTKAPQHFGIASQDINCHCTMRIEIEEGKQ